MRTKFDPIAHAEEAWRMMAFPVKVTAAAKNFRREATGTGTSTRYIRAIEYEEDGMKHRGAFVVRIIHGSGIPPPYWIDSSRKIRGSLERASSDAAVGLANGWEPFDADEAAERIAICLWKSMRPAKEVDVRTDELYTVRVIDGAAVAECRVRYWSPANQSKDEWDSVLPKFGTLKVAINAETNQLISAECRSDDRTTVLATMRSGSLKNIYESAGVQMSPGGPCRVTTALDMQRRPS